MYLQCGVNGHGGVPAHVRVVVGREIERELATIRQEEIVQVNE